MNARVVRTTAVCDTADIRSFFDRCASAGYAEQHGDAQRLLEYRLDLVRRHARLRSTDVVLDVGCGNGHHLFALAPEMARGMGVDVSPGLIDVARARLAASSLAPWAPRLGFQVDDAETLRSIPDRSVDLAICIGALEHMLDKRAVLAAVGRVLVSGGRFFCLTPDGGYLWYRVASLLGLATKHLSTDRFVTWSELAALLRQAGFARLEHGPWTFIPKGDMPRPVGVLLEALDAAGRRLRLHAFRGGLWVCARKE